MHGVIVINKPAGPTSAEVVRRIKSALGRRTRVGHLGTLDPLASGVLPILVGEGTKLAPFLQRGEKEYIGLIALGAETDTLDCAGRVIRTAEVPALDPARLRGLADRFTGTVEQIPPVFSAIKRAGVPLYRQARRGDEVEPPPPRRVKIMRLELTPAEPAAIRFELRCSTGTYVRALARDIGVALNTAAHLRELRRTRSGSFTIGQAEPLPDVIAAIAACRDPGLIGLREAIAEMPEAEIGDELERRLRNGDSRVLDCLAPAGATLFKVIVRGQLVAVAEASSRATARVARVFTAG